MSEPDYRKLYEKIERDAQARMDLLAQFALERRQSELAAHNAKLTSVQLHKDDVMQCMLEQLEHEITSLSAQRAHSSSMAERAELKAAIVHLKQTLESAKSDNRRKPPESGLPVPAEPPKDPRPKLGGAAASLDFDS